VFAVFMVASSAFALACSAILDIPDRELDTLDASSPQDVTVESSPPADVDQRADTGPADAPIDARRDVATAQLSAPTLDFGPSGCGAGESDADAEAGGGGTDAGGLATRTLTLTNAGIVPLSWEASLSSTPEFALVGNASGSIAPGASDSVTVSAQPIAISATAGAVLQAVLTLTMNDPAHLSVDVPVTITASGATIAISPGTADFGQVKVNNAATPIPITVQNVGNAPVTVSVAQPADPQLSLTSGGSLSNVTLPAGGSVTGLVAHFTPTSTNVTTDTAVVTTAVGSVLCGTNDAIIGFSGQGTLGSATVQPGSLDFGTVSCGTQAVAKIVTLSNVGTAPYTWGASLGSTNYYTLSTPTNGALAPGANVVITVTPAPIPGPPQTASVTSRFYSDQLTIIENATADGGNETIIVPLYETAGGAILTESPATLPFGYVPVGTPSTAQFGVSNLGNAPATVSFTVSPAAFAVAPQGQLVPGGSSYTANATFAPTGTGAVSGAAKVTVSSTVLCAPLPPDIAMTGTGTLIPVSVSPTSVDFGLVHCGARAPAQTVTLRNTGAGNQSFTWSATVTTPDGGIPPFAIGPNGGTLGPNRSVGIVVTPNAIPAVSPTSANYFGATLTITTNVPGDSPHVVPLTETAQGAILSFAGSLAFGGVKTGKRETLTLGIVNNGNTTPTVTLTRTGSGASAFTFASPSIAANGDGATTGDDVTFAPTMVTTYAAQATMSVAGGTPLCAPLPGAANLTGNGM
jgi:hypothetical protein